MSDGAVHEGTYLDRIVPAVRRRLEERKARLPQVELEMRSGPGRRPSFAAALALPGISLIAEVKRASPSRGPIRPTLDVEGLTSAYERAGARAVSVITEQDHFLGGPEDLSLAAASTGLPLLRKDFVFDPYQILEARWLGASAVLLIASLLDDRALQRLADLALSLGLDVLLEVHDEVEMDRALAVEGVVIGVNNRDLRTFRVSLETTGRLAPLVPPARLLVSESGIRDRKDVTALASMGVDAVLVGESILQEQDVEVAIRALVDPLPDRGERPAGHTQGREDR